MCLQLFVAASEPIDPPYDPAVGGLGGIVRLPEAKAGELRAFTKPYVYAIWFTNSCGRGCARPGSPLRRALVALLEWALGSVPEVELYTCQQGHEGAAPNVRDWCMPTELLHLRVFEGASCSWSTRTPDHVLRLTKPDCCMAWGEKLPPPPGRRAR